MADTFFTKIIKKEIPAEFVYEDEFVVAFKDIEPKAPVHILIVPREPIPTINDINSDNEYILGKIAIAAGKIAKQFDIDQSGYRMVMNCNKDAGQTVFHLHCHLLGGKELKWTF